MTFRQNLLARIYPIYRAISHLIHFRSKIKSSNAKPLVPFYSLKMQLNNGDIFSFEQLKGKKVIIVNTASDCIYTVQYADLQKLYSESAGNLMILAFPSNDFKQQEKGDDSVIADFCQRQFHITFPIMHKSGVLRKGEQNPVYQWLTHANLNGWNNSTPSWNFCKYLVNEEGHLTHFLESNASPLYFFR